MKKIAIKNIKNKFHAQELAINWQSWQSTKTLSYGECIEWAEYFSEIGKKFNLITEFKENSII